MFDNLLALTGSARSQHVTAPPPPAPLPPVRGSGVDAIGGAGEAGIRIRPGTPGDLPFIDALQKRHGKQLCFMNRTTLEGKVAAGHVLVSVRRQ
jgi:hypothetical protein